MEAIAASHMIVANRLAKSTSELDASELAWWQRFSEVEELYCWVQTPQLQSYLRGKYVRQVARIAKKHRTVLELGTGVGWFSILLAKHGVDHVIGIDFSEEQIERAREQSVAQKVESRTEFLVCSPEDLVLEKRKYGVILMHGFLHHLSVEEIVSVLASVKNLIAEGGRIIVWEPIRYSNRQGSRIAALLYDVIRRLQDLPLKIHKRGLRRMSAAEQDARRLIAKRSEGVRPLGPSPKEAPFESEHLEELLRAEFMIHNRTRCMAVSHLAAQEFLLMQLTYPKLAGVLMWPILAIAKSLERLMLTSQNLPSDIWSFEMFECELSKNHASVGR